MIDESGIISVKARDVRNEKETDFTLRLKIENENFEYIGNILKLFGGKLLKKLAKPSSLEGKNRACEKRGSRASEKA
ncbi:MAG: hypothetical protein LRY51_15760 [Geovibrio sp.]|nr:hypothetical protein [Geovibrio sp.]